MGQEPILGFESRVSETSTVQPVLPWGAMPGMGVGGRKSRAQEEGKSNKLGGLMSEPGRSSHRG